MENKWSKTHQTIGTTPANIASVSVKCHCVSWCHHQHDLKGLQCPCKMHGSSSNRKEEKLDSKTVIKPELDSSVSEQKECNCICHFDSKSYSNIPDGKVMGCGTCNFTGQKESVFSDEPRKITDKCCSPSIQERGHIASVNTMVERETEWEGLVWKKIWEFDKVALNDMGEKYNINEFQVQELIKLVSKEKQLTAEQTRKETQKEAISRVINEIARDTYWETGAFDIDKFSERLKSIKF